MSRNFFSFFQKLETPSLKTGFFKNGLKRVRKPSQTNTIQSLKTWVFIFFVLFLYGCNDSTKNNAAIKIGIDPEWHLNDFGALEPYVNGFVEEFLLEVHKQTGIQFELIPASWSSLMQNMNQGSYSAVLSSLAPYNFNLAQYDFSQNFLDCGPVLVIPTESPLSDLRQFNDQQIGVVAGDPSTLILQKYEGIMIRQYPSIPLLLEAVSNGEIEGALVAKLPAVNYVRDLFAGKLRISGEPLDPSGLHLIVLKNSQPKLLREFNQSIAHLKKKKTIDALLKKWQLN